MKKIAFFISIILISSFSVLKSQISKGKTLLGVSTSLGIAGTGPNIMSIGYSTSTDKSDESGYVEPKSSTMTSVNFLPKFGYFVIDNLAVGVDVSFAYSKNERGESSYWTKRTMFSVGPFVRYYIPTKVVMPFFELEGEYGFISSKYNSGMSNDENNSSLFILGGGAGIAVPVGERVTIDAMLGYNSMTVKQTNDNVNNEREVIGTIGLKLGFIVLL